MEFLEKNARALIIALLAVGVVVAISVSGDSGNEENNTPETSEVVSSDGLTADTSESTDDLVENNSKANDEDGVAEEPASADEEQSAATSAETESSSSTGEVTRSGDDYSIAANAGDSQTVMMRELIAQYEKENDVTLSAPQRLYAETNLVNDITRSDYIEIGDTIKLTGADIKERVEEARNLTESELNLWSQYL